jgi:alkylation response protein AidB-like acyl-CoA dehydrogenase
MSGFVVDLDSDGITKNKLNKLGWRASDTAELFFDNVKVPVSNLLGKEGDGFLYLAMHLAMERIIMAINAHARAEYAIEYTLKYMKERTAFGKNLDKFQALRHTMADLIIDVDHIKTYNYKVIDNIMSGGYPVLEASSAKRKSTEVADKVIYDCLQMLGGYGYMEEYELARMSRDSRLGPIGGGTSEIMKEIVAKIAIDGKIFKRPVLDL